MGTNVKITSLLPGRNRGRSYAGLTPAYLCWHGVMASPYRKPTDFQFLEFCAMLHE